MAETITPVLLAGGSGTRLWPVSRRAFPKQFARLTGDATMFQAAARRARGPGYAAPVVVTAAPFRFIVAEQLAGAGIEPDAILLEPEPRSTGPAVLAAALRAAPGALLLVMPSDHLIPDAAAFRAAVEAARPAAAAGRIVTFGVRPARPETGYGYVLPEGPGLSPVKEFLEKPDRAGAEALIAAGALWNAGIFLFRADAMVAAAGAAAPGMLGPVRAALAGAAPDLGFWRLDAAAWAGAPDVSLDRAVMERAPNLSVQPLEAAWSDLGDWTAIARRLGGGAVQGPAHALDCEGTVLRSDGPRLVGIGLRDVVAVAMDDAVLVMDAGRGQEVGRAVEAMRAAGAPEADAFGREHRPWGGFDRLAEGEGFQVKRIVVRPGGILSLQSHEHRAEHWVVVSGRLRVTLEDEARDLSANESIYVPRGARHRLENPGAADAVLIEVQTGAYLGEDDITRYEDAYARAPDGTPG
ncbi:MAG: mannose-1-phosphate guanylyltransferase/mannose-6-phosphate isomerase [Hasllibacter sp.]